MNCSGVEVVVAVKCRVAMVCSLLGEDLLLSGCQVRSSGDPSRPSKTLVCREHPGAA
jgi:hypothetical protein